MKFKMFLHILIHKAYLLDTPKAVYPIEIIGGKEQECKVY
jgi:hypothetical protein